MKKSIFTALLLLAMLISSTGSAFAGSVVELISVVNDGGGVKFTFRVSDGFSQDELKGSGQISGGDDFDLDCKADDEDPTLVVCHAPKKAGGHSVMVTFGGATFWADVPVETIWAPEATCYNGWVTQYYSNAEIFYGSNGQQVGFSISASTVIGTGLEQHLVFCSDNPNATPPELALVTHGIYESILRFNSNGTSFCGVPNNGTGYYPIFCIN